MILPLRNCASVTRFTQYLLITTLSLTFTAQLAFSADWSRTEIINYANLSPKYVKDHNKDGWVGLFDDDDSFVEDPVGGYHFVKNQSQNQISFFWDAFIAKNDITFIIARDIVSDLTVIRDAVVHAVIPSINQIVDTPAHLRYTLEDQSGSLRVKSLQAYWSMPTAISDTLGRGVTGLKIMGAQLGEIFRGLGVDEGLDHFLKAWIVGVHHCGQREVAQMTAALSHGQSHDFLKTFSKRGVVVFNSTHTSISPQEFFDGHYVIANPYKIISAGESVAMNCDLIRNNGKPQPIFAVANFKRLKIVSLELFTDSRR